MDQRPYIEEVSSKTFVNKTEEAYEADGVFDR